LLVWLAGANVTHAAYEVYQLPDPSRRWSVNVSLREGYDDNVNTSSANKQGATTTAIEPQLLVNIPLETTSFGLRYTYGATYYSTHGSTIDQSHRAELAFSHTFTSRLALSMSDNVVRGLQPELVQLTTGVPVITRIRGDYLYNDLNGTLSYALLQRWTLSVGGTWQLWRYDDLAISIANDLDQYEATLAAFYAISPRTSVGVNYQYGMVNYVNQGTAGSRNSKSNTGFLSLVRRFNPKLSLQVNGGYELRDFDDGTSESAPSVNASLSFNYAPRSAVTAGFSYQLSTTEVATYRATEAASLFGQINHAFTPKFNALANVAYSLFTFRSPTPGSLLPPGLQETGFQTGLTLTYEFQRWLSADLRYTYTQATSDLAGRSFDRNQVSMGLRFTY
jgi:hypothetical protein